MIQVIYEFHDLSLTLDVEPLLVRSLLVLGVAQMALVQDDVVHVLLVANLDDRLVLGVGGEH